MDTELKTESATPAPQDINAHEAVAPAASKIGGFLIFVGFGLVVGFLQNLGNLRVSHSTSRRNMGEVHNAGLYELSSILETGFII